MSVMLFECVGMVFGISMIVWFLGILFGFVMLGVVLLS